VDQRRLVALEVAEQVGHVLAQLADGDYPEFRARRGGSAI
jgi:hypothetical protein